MVQPPPHRLRIRVAWTICLGWSAAACGGAPGALGTNVPEAAAPPAFTRGPELPGATTVSPSEPSEPPAHAESPAAGASQAPRDALGRFPSPVAGGVDLELIAHTGGIATSVAKQGNRVYMLVGRLLKVVDVTNPAEPSTAGLLVLEVEDTADLAVAGDQVLVAARDAGVIVVEAAGPGPPREVARIDTEGDALELEVAGDRAYIAMGPAGLQVVEVGSPSRTRAIGRLGGLGDVVSVAVSGDTVYLGVVGHAGGLRIVDVTLPARPRRVGALELAADSIAIAAKADRVYASVYARAYEKLSVGQVMTVPGGRLLVIDASDPSAPQAMVTESATLREEATRRGEALRQRLGAAGESGAIDLPEVVGPLANAPSAAVQYSGRLVVDSIRPLAHMAARSALIVFDLAAGSPPVEVGSYSAVACQFRGFDDLVVDGNLAYAVGGQGLHVVDVGEPAEPRLVGVLEGPMLASSVTVADSEAAVTGCDLALLDIADPVKPRIDSRLGAGWFPRDLVIDGRLAYLLDGEAGLHVVDLDDPREPLDRHGARSHDRPATDMAVRDRLAYLTVGNGLQVLDLSDPGSPREVSVEIDGVANHGTNRIALDGDHAYVTDAEIGLQVLDLRDPAAPHEVGRLEIPGRAADLVVQDGHAFVADDKGGGLLAVDLSDPTQPRQVGLLPLPSASAIAVAGRRAFVAGGDGFVHVVDIGNPSAMRWLGGARVPGHGVGIAVAGDLVLVAGHRGGVSILRAGNG